MIHLIAVRNKRRHRLNMATFQVSSNRYELESHAHFTCRVSPGLGYRTSLNRRLFTIVSRTRT
jgi:hypothetical protein